MGPWHFVEDPVQWTGPAVPLRAPEESTEPFMTEKAKTNFNGLNLLPWEGAQVVGPEMARIIDVGLVELAVDENKNRPVTKHLPDQNTLHHMRRAVADVHASVKPVVIDIVNYARPKLEATVLLAREKALATKVVLEVVLAKALELVQEALNGDGKKK